MSKYSLLIVLFFVFPAFFIPTIFAEMPELEAPIDVQWTLEKCLQYGIKSHPLLKTAESSIDSGKAKLLQAKSGHDLNISLRASWNRDRQDASSNPITEKYSDNRSESVSMGKTLYDSGRLQLQEKSAKELLASAVSKRDTTFIEVCTNIKTAFFRAQQTQVLLQVKIEALESYKEHLERVRSLVEIGNRPPYDITRAQVDVANARVELISAKSNIKIALAELAKATGHRKSINIAKFDKENLPTLNENTEQLLKEAMGHPEMDSSISQVRAAKIGVDEAKKTLKPYISASADYSWSGISTPQDRRWGVGLSISWPVFEGDLARAKIDSARSQVDGTSASHENLQLSISVNLENSLTNLNDALERYDATNYLVQQASETLDLAEARYNAGLSTPLEITDARVEFEKARASHIVAYFDSIIARSELDKVLGRLPQEISKYEVITISDNWSKSK